MGRGETTINEILANAVECSDVIEFGTTFHWHGKDGITIIDIADENVFVAETGSDGKVAGEIGRNFRAEFGDGRENEVGFCM